MSDSIDRNVHADDESRPGPPRQGRRVQLSEDDIKLIAEVSKRSADVLARLAPQLNNKLESSLRGWNDAGEYSEAGNFIAALLARKAIVINKKDWQAVRDFLLFFNLDLLDKSMIYLHRRDEILDTAIIVET